MVDRIAEASDRFANVPIRKNAQEQRNEKWALFSQPERVRWRGLVTCLPVVGPRIAGKFQFSGAAIRGR
jgi:hypothetical protein